MALGHWASIRCGNVVVAFFGVLVGGIAATGASPQVGPMLFAAGLAALGVSGANLVNDALDWRLDRAAHPHRRVAKGIVAPVDALRAGVGLIWLALVGSLATNALVVLTVTAMALLVVAYEGWGKRHGLFGNALVSANVGGLFLLGSWAASLGWFEFDESVVGMTVRDGATMIGLAMAGLAFGLNLSRELFKDAQDEAADRATRTTYAVRHGPQAASTLARIVAGSTLAIAILPWATGWFGSSYAVALLPLAFVLSWALFSRSPMRAQRRLKAAMVLGFLPFLATALI